MKGNSFNRLVIFFLSITIMPMTAFFSYGRRQTNNTPSKTRYHQQVNDMCMVAPMLNYAILNKIHQEYGTYVPKKGLSGNVFTRRQWFGENHRYLKTWHNALNSINVFEDDNPLKQYVINSVKEGPIVPHFYKSDGSFWKTNFFDFIQIPYFLIDRDALYVAKETFPYLPSPSAAGLSIPFVKKADGYLYGYNKDSHKYDKFQLRSSGELSQYYPYNGVEKQWSYSIDMKDFESVEGKKLLTDDIYQKIGDFPWAFMNKSSLLGFKGVTSVQGINLYLIGEQLNLNKDQYYYYLTYLSGLYHLMLLNLGIDNTNTVIAPPENLATQSASATLQQKAMHSLQRLMNKDEEYNPWSTRYFTREKFFQYHLAELFKNDKKLMKQMESVISFSPYRPWDHHVSFLDSVRKEEVYDQYKKPYVLSSVEKFLPGKEQMLAYITTQLLRLLWYGALNPKAFYEETTPKTTGFRGWFIRKWAHLPRWSFEIYTNGAYEKKDIKIEGKKYNLSFIDVWQDIVEGLQPVINTHKNFISFDGHGWVICFSPEIIEAQRKSLVAGRANVRLFSDLKFTGIESYLSSKLGGYYLE